MRAFFDTRHLKAVGVTLFIMCCLFFAAASSGSDLESGSRIIFLVSEISSALFSLITGIFLLIWFYGSGNKFLFISSTALVSNGLGVIIHTIILWSRYSSSVQSDYSAMNAGIFTGQFIIGVLTFTALILQKRKTKSLPVESSRKTVLYAYLFIAAILFLITTTLTPAFLSNIEIPSVLTTSMSYIAAITFALSFTILTHKYIKHERSPLIWGSMTGTGIHTAGYILALLYPENHSVLLPSIFFRATGFSIALLSFLFQKIILIKQLYDQRNELQKSQRVLKEILDTIPIAVFWKDMNLNYLGCNRTFSKDARMKSPEDVIGKSDYQLNWSDMADIYRKTDEAVLSTDAPRLSYEESMSNSTATPDWLKKSKVPLKDNEGNTWGILGIYENITGRKHSELKLKEYTSNLEKLNEELKDKNRELDEFVFIASHDLQEPLRKVIAFSELLKKDAGENLSELARRDMDFISESVNRMSRLLTDLLRYSRSNSKELSIIKVPFENIVREAMDNLSTVIEEREAVIEYGDLPRVYCDSTFMIQVIQNILSNSIKYSRQTPHIKLTVIRDGGFYKFTVTDNGIGIKREYLEHIFSPFRRLHGKREFEGSGIGLSICRKIVRRHGGDIYAESSGENGSSFIFTIPAQKE